MKKLVPHSTGDGLVGGVALVTGAGAGLGRVEALALGAAGAHVVVNDLTDAAEVVAAEINAAGGSAVAIRGDIADWDFAVGLVRRVIAEHGDLNILVNNAGIVRDRMIFSMTAPEWDSVIAVHLRGHAATCHAATAYWRERSKTTGDRQWARIINTSSEAFLFGPAGQPNYAAAKAGIVALTLSVAQGAASYGVTANALAPRARTAMTETVFGSAPDGDEIDSLSPEHIPPVVVWLAQRSSAVVTGQVFVVYGGKVGVMKAPELDGVFTASGESWTVGELDRVVGGFLADGGRHGYAVGDDLAL